MAEEQVVIDVKIDAERAAKELASLSTQLSVLKQLQKDFNAQMSSGKDESGEAAAAYARVTKQINTLTAEQKALTGQLQAASPVGAKLTGSFREMDAACRQLENEYKALSKAERDSAEGQKLKESLIAAKQELKDFDAELGNHQRNVGNYPQAVSVLDGALGKIGTTTDEVANGGLKAMAAGIKATMKSALAFLATPFGAVMAAVAVAVKAVTEAFRKNDEALTGVKKLFASLEPVINVVKGVFVKLAEAIGWVAEKLAGLIGAFSEEAAEVSNAVDAMDELQDAERAYTIASAKRQQEISDLRAKIAEKDKYNVTERLRMMDEVIAKEGDDLKERKRIAEEKARLLEEQAKREHDTSDETKDAIAAAKAAVIAEETAYNQKMRELQAERQGYISEEKSLRAAAAKAAKDEAAAKAKAAEEAAAAEREAEEAAEEEKRRAEAERLERVAAQRADAQMAMEDAVLAAMRDGQAKELAQIDIDTARKAEAIRAQYAELAADSEQGAAEVEALVNAAKEQGLKERQAIIDKYAETEQATVRANAETTAAAMMTAAQNTGQMFSALSSLLDEYGDDSEAAAKAARAAALVQLGISEAMVLANTAQSISAAVAGATTSGTATGPGAVVATPLFIAQMVAAVTAGLAGTIANIQQAKTALEDAGSYNAGGVVPGGSYTGDRLTAKVNSGEMILTQAQQRRLFEVANGGLYRDDSAIIDGLAAAVERMPAPVMVYKEFAEFERRTVSVKEFAKIR